MIIVSQDKKTIINFESTTRMSIVPPEEEGYKYSIAINSCLDLGYYKTEERAKEVLEEIIQKIEDVSWTNLIDNLQIAMHDKNFGGALSSIYRMPEE